MPSVESLVGKTLTCHVTGKTFIGAADGCSTNYARDSFGNVYSDEGVDITEKRELLDRSKPFFCYLSSDESKITGWKGNVLGTVIYRTHHKNPRRSYTSGTITCVRVRDCHGGLWYGRGCGGGMCITLRPMKG